MVYSDMLDAIVSAVIVFLAMLIVAVMGMFAPAGVTGGGSAGPMPSSLITTEYGVGPTVLLIPNDSAESFDWKHTDRQRTDALGVSLTNYSLQKHIADRGYRAVTFDPPGYGVNTQYPVSATVADYVQLLHERIGNTELVIGHGTGALVAQKYGEKYACDYIMLDPTAAPALDWHPISLIYTDLAIADDPTIAATTYPKTHGTAPSHWSHPEVLMSAIPSKYYFHGSGKRLDVLEPHPSNVIDNESAVFATNSLSSALMFIGRWNDADIEHGHWGPTEESAYHHYAREKYAGAFNLLKVPGYIHYVDSAPFHWDARLGLDTEFISSEPVPVVKVEHVLDVFDRLTSDGVVELIPFGKKSSFD